MDYLNGACLICFDEMNKINQRRENIVIENNNLIKSLTEREKIIPEAISKISEEEFSNNYESAMTSSSTSRKALAAEESSVSLR